ncbi:MAG: non-canonical purine NTP diphosphatase [Bacteroidales bacterium]|nr:non-canonical purine NTP diphosphatase [Bacteroidales bacterium]
MARQLVFATNNAHKLDEVRQMVGNHFTLLSLNDIGCTDEIAETGDTLEANALIKARYIYERYGLDCFADDTGLEVTALDGRPGVHTARYAHPDRNDHAANMAKLQCELANKTDRSARFRTVIALIEDGKEHLFSGEVMGNIMPEARGKGGFGYDPVFAPHEYGGVQTFAELGDGIKFQISHRARAVQALTDYLHQHAHEP